MQRQHNRYKSRNTTCDQRGGIKRKSHRESLGVLKERNPLDSLDSTGEHRLANAKITNPNDTQELEPTHRYWRRNSGAIRP